MAKTIKLDFSKVEERSGWNTKTIPEGLHKFKIVDVQETEASGDGADMLVFALVPTDARYKARRFPYYCKLVPSQLWKLRDLLVAAGVSVPKKVVNIVPNKAVGKIVVGEVSDETGQYQGRSSIDNIYDLSVWEDGDDSSDDETDEDEADEEYEGDEDESEEDDERAEELAAMGLPALRKEAKGLGIDTTGLKKDDLIEAILEAEDEDSEDEDDEDEDDDLDDEELEDEEDDEDYEDEEDEEEEDEEPAPRRSSKKAPARKAPAKPAAKAAPARRSIKRR